MVGRKPETIPEDMQKGIRERISKIQAGERPVAEAGGAAVKWTLRVTLSAFARCHFCYIPSDASKVKWSASSVSGTKKNANDDSWLVFSAGLNISTKLQEAGAHATDTDLVLAVSDGMGRATPGDLASTMLLDQLSQIIPRTLRLALRATLITLSSSRSSCMKLTIVSAEEIKPLNAKVWQPPSLWLGSPENLYIGHVGDSRLYRFRDGETQQSPRPQFCMEAISSGELSEAAYRRHPRRHVLHEIVGGGHRRLRPFLKLCPIKTIVLCSATIALWMAYHKKKSILN